MSSTSNVQLTEEQEKFLSSLEEEFKDRYTENDEEFKAVLNEKPPIPPVIGNWKDFRPRNERQYSYQYNRRRELEDSRRRDQCCNDYDGRYSHTSRHDYRYREHNHSGKKYFPY